MFLGWAHLRKRAPATALRHEHRVVTETPKAARDRHDLPFDDTLADDLGAIGKATDHDGAKARPPVDLALEDGEQLGDVVGVGGGLPSKAGRPRAGGPAERHHLETGVVRDRGLAGRCNECDGLETSVVLEALPGLLDRANALRTSNELDQVIELLFQNGP